MRLPFPLHMHSRRGLLVYQLVLILIAIIVLILVLLYVARRNQIGTTASGAQSTPSYELTRDVEFAGRDRLQSDTTY